MILVKPSFEILEIMGIDGVGQDALELIEKAGRTCYKSEDRIDGNSALKFTESILKRGHESVIEHSAMTVKFICDRGVSHELVRHRLCAFSQESTRYCNYKGGVTFVIPPWLDVREGEYGDTSLASYILSFSTSKTSASKSCWLNAMLRSERSYTELLNYDWSPQQARSVLPNSTKTEIVITANFREWRHIFKLRCAKVAHPQMREIMIPLHRKCKESIPIIFDDIGEHDA